MSCARIFRRKGKPANEATEESDASPSPPPPPPSPPSQYPPPIEREGPGGKYVTVTYLSPVFGFFAKNNGDGFASIDSVKPNSPSDGRVQPGDIFYRIGNVNVFKANANVIMQAIAARKQQPISDESPLELEFFRGDAHAVPDEEMDEEELEEEDDEEEEEDEEGRTPHRKPASFTVVPPKQQTKREQGPNNDAPTSPPRTAPAAVVPPPPPPPPPPRSSPPKASPPKPSPTASGVPSVIEEEDADFDEDEDDEFDDDLSEVDLPMDSPSKPTIVQQISAPALLSTGRRMSNGGSAGSGGRSGSAGGRSPVKSPIAPSDEEEEEDEAVGNDPIASVSSPDVSEDGNEAPDASSAEEESSVSRSSSGERREREKERQSRHSHHRSRSRDKRSSRSRSHHSRREEEDERRHRHHRRSSSRHHSRSRSPTSRRHSRSRHSDRDRHRRSSSHRSNSSDRDRHRHSRHRSGSRSHSRGHSAQRSITDSPKSTLRVNTLDVGGVEPVSIPSTHVTPVRVLAAPFLAGGLSVAPVAAVTVPSEPSIMMSMRQQGASSVASSTYPQPQPMIPFSGLPQVVRRPGNGGVSIPAPQLASPTRNESHSLPPRRSHSLSTPERSTQTRVPAAFRMQLGGEEAQLSEKWRPPAATTDDDDDLNSDDSPILRTRSISVDAASRRPARRSHDTLRKHHSYVKPGPRKRSVSPLLRFLRENDLDYDSDDTSGGGGFYSVPVQPSPSSHVGMSPNSPSAVTRARNTALLKRAARVHAAIQAQQVSLTLRQTERELRGSAREPSSPDRQQGKQQSAGDESTSDSVKRLQEMRSAVQTKQSALNSLLASVSDDPSAMGSAKPKSVSNKTTVSTVVKRTPKFVRPLVEPDPFDVGSPLYPRRGPLTSSRQSSAANSVDGGAGFKRVEPSQPVVTLTHAELDLVVSAAQAAAIAEVNAVSPPLSPNVDADEERKTGESAGPVPMSSGLQRLQELRRQAERSGRGISQISSIKLMPAAQMKPPPPPSTTSVFSVGSTATLPGNTAPRRIFKETQTLQAATTKRPSQLNPSPPPPLSDFDPKRSDSRISTWSVSSAVTSGREGSAGLHQRLNPSPWSSASSAQGFVSVTTVAGPALKVPVVLDAPLPSTSPSYADKPKLSRRVGGAGNTMPIPSLTPQALGSNRPANTASTMSPASANRRKRLEKLFG